jgi:FlaA1/EpsC-like NDP-sugar epimerase
VSVKNLRDVDVDDLLGRDMVELNTAQISGYLQGKKVLVTGAGGSIGSELCRQIIRYEPTDLILFDVYENGVYDLQQELLAKQRGETNATTKLHVLIGSVCDKQRVEAVFNTYRPNIIYHAAAHKHVPLMEDSPHEAVRNNVFGTLNLATCADAVGVSRFVMISTDKAVNPTNIMGATKRICEMIVQSFAQKSKTAFVAVRFGNVLGSNGSVIPLFKKQIEAGGPVTVTHPDIIRYFMTITEAASLVIQAGAYANGGEIFVLDMGEQVKIAELAVNLIKMSGFTPGRDIEIVYTGLRPGEKLYEEMLMNEEGMTKTDNQLIYIGKPLHFDGEAFTRQIDELWHTAQDESSDIRGLVARITGTYKYSGQ